jgi:hypothetical protein
MDGWKKVLQIDAQEHTSMNMLVSIRANTSLWNKAVHGILDDIHIGQHRM